MFSTEASNRPGASPVVLVVDDIGTNRQVATLLGRKLGWEVASVSSGAEALSWLALHRAALVLMDVHMPDVDGIMTTRLLRSGGHVLQPDVPVMFVTADAQRETHARCLDAGGQGVVYKPLTLEKLARAADPLLNAPAAPSPARARALIADPNDGPRNTLRTLLEERGFVVDTVDSGETAIDTARRVPYDLVFAAAEMALDGVEVGRQLRIAGAASGDARLILVSRHPQVDLDAIFLHVGGDGTLTGALDATNLTEALHRCGWTRRNTRSIESV